MTLSHTLGALLVFSITACSLFEPVDCFAHCGHAPQVVDSKVGEIRSSAYHSWSYRFGYISDCWVIKGSEDEPIVLSFAQFSVRCEKESLSIKSSAGGGEPIVLCGTKLPQPLEFPGGNISLVHHFSPHVFPVSSFMLNYARDSGECPETSFRCPRGRCLPPSWRCNGQVECLGDGLHNGLDEVGCDDYVDYAEAKAVTYTDRNAELDKSRTVDKSWLRSTEQYNVPDSWSPQREWQQPVRGQPTQKELVVTPTPMEWPCGGLLRTFYGTFSSPSSASGMMSCLWTLDPQDSRPLRLDLQQISLGPWDRLTVYNREEGKGDIIKNITYMFNYKSVKVESHTGLMSLAFERAADSMGNGFKATFHVGSYCPPWEARCGGAAGGCYTKEQRCDGKWDCPETGKDEQGCRGCGENQFACGLGGLRPPPASGYLGMAVCYPATERCNYQLYCTDGSDEKDCSVCQPGTFHCDSNRCVFESWRCDGQVDCKDGTDELNCTVTLPRKVITAATVGSLICGLLLVIAMGCTCKLYSLRTREYSSMFAPINRLEAEMIQQQAPPSYGQLIAQGIIPPVEDFPTESPNETSSLSLRGILQLLRQDASSSPHRRRRPRFVRRVVRRMRRWGLIPRTSSRQNQTSGSGQQEADSAPSSQEAAQSSPARSSSATEAGSQPVRQKLGLLALVEQQLPPPPPEEMAASLLPPPPLFSAPPPPYAPPAPPLTTPPVAVPPSSPSLASIFQTLGLSISLFRASPSTSQRALSASPSFSSSSSASSDDEVLLIPLSEDTASEDDVPMLT
ncbi:low-density lipoprotein receptor-related protein 10 isoform X1 [Fundulus heteroclitus]|uniref:low-density lipoprotein receptor-related protein 10 isoform X1 n=1 Tax=Fundulus heteroclitus TaxID=8078 RepID=UPI00165A19C0|nr:low-density lipoprotein receptor-related protein 10 isoform X1 [Fundulus heteroclitus]XP_036002246.1 low-density lipoprotein receptor-related protein 10 isoform X1 [Fundulus heteroclitus]XP_036002247.1 low-density lipoprotein receptor-related protein 10 isoform X1 [Fundulus heteroclitus]